MKRDKQEKREIRSILLGKSLIAEDGRITAKEPGMLIMPQGVVDGAGAVRFFGIRAKDCLYETELGEDALLEAAEQTMRSMGRAVALREQPETPACLIRYAMTGPVVLVFRFAEGRPVLAAWTARGLMGWLTRRRAVAAFERAMPEGLRPVAEEKANRKKREKTPENAPTPEENAEETQAEEPQTKKEDEKS